MNRLVARERGSMAVEVAVLAPIIVIFVLLMVGVGRVVEAQGQVGGAARDAARAASVQRDLASADRAARDAAVADLAGRCDGGPGALHVRHVAGAFAPGSLVTYRVECTISLRGLTILGYAPTRTVSAESTAPLDTFRGTR